MSTFAVVIPTLHRDPRPIMAQLEAQTDPDWIGVLVVQSDYPPRLDLPPMVDRGVNRPEPDLAGYARWIVVHAPWQRGSSAARNLGRGIVRHLDPRPEYLWFVDDDDTIPPTALADFRRAFAPGIEAVVARVEDQGKLLPDYLYSTPRVCYRRRASGWCPWGAGGPGQDQRYHTLVLGTLGKAQVARIESVVCVCGNAQTGGLRAPDGRF